MEYLTELKALVGKIEVEIPKLYQKERKVSGLRIRAYLKEINDVVRGLRADTLSFEKEIKDNSSINKDLTYKFNEEDDDSNIDE